MSVLEPARMPRSFCDATCPTRCAMQRRSAGLRASTARCAWPRDPRPTRTQPGPAPCGAPLQGIACAARFRRLPCADAKPLYDDSAQRYPCADKHALGIGNIQSRPANANRKELRANCTRKLQGTGTQKRTPISLPRCLSPKPARARWRKGDGAPGGRGLRRRCRLR